jgi:hypothetical protein
MQLSKTGIIAVNMKNKQLLSVLAVKIVPICIVALSFIGFAGPAAADNLAQGFTAKGTLSPGMIVALTKNAQNTVEAASGGDTSKIFGVVIDPSDAPLLLNRQTGDQIFVANSGTYPVLVSTERGNIKTGDYITVSSTDGIGAEATPAQSAVLGQATTPFDGSKDSVTKIGGFAVGKITVTVNPRKNPLIKNDISIPPFLRKVGEAIAGHPVSPLHIYAALAFLLSAVTIATALLTAGIRGGMIALGRNPLNKGSIMNSMFKVVIAAVMIFVIGLFGVYLLLKI